MVFFTAEFLLGPWLTPFSAALGSRTLPLEARLLAALQDSDCICTLCN
jgi:hypothetical protein